MFSRTVTRWALSFCFSFFFFFFLFLMGRFERCVYDWCLIRKGMDSQYTGYLKSAPKGKNRDLQTANAPNKQFKNGRCHQPQIIPRPLKQCFQELLLFCVIRALKTFKFFSCALFRCTKQAQNYHPHTTRFRLSVNG